MVTPQGRGRDSMHSSSRTVTRVERPRAGGERYLADENHALRLVALDKVKNAWVRGVVAVQLRVPRTSGDERWRRSVYVSEAETTYTLPFADFTPLGDPPPAALDLAAAHGVLFGVDAVNSAPSASGRFWLRDVVVE